jgi:carboxyl-terminal processing protease
MRLAARLLLLLSLPLAAQQTDPGNAAELERELIRFLEVFRIVNEEAADPLDQEQAFYRGALPAMLRKLDPHSVFFDKDQFEQLQQMERSVSKGFGSVVSVLPGRVIILQTTNGSPSQKAGLQPGDEIVAINGYVLGGLELEQLVQLLGATRQREATLLVRRQGTAQPLPVTLVPAELASPTVDRVFMVQPGVGYVRATSFDANTGKQLKEAIDSLGGEKLKALILDLRDNPGGVVAAGLETASLFLKPKQRIITARGRNAQTQPIDVPDDATPYSFKLAVLVNSRTGSAAEIVAGAIQDHDRGLILGEPTFGKGLVQRVFPLSDQTGLALTTAYYYTPSGRSIQKPLRDVELSATTAVRDRPEYKTDSGRIVRGGGGIDPDHLVYPEQPTRFRAVLETTASFANFATEWLAKNKNAAGKAFDAGPAVMDEFQLFLSRRNIRPSLAEWSAERQWMRHRLRQEILNQSVGVAAGDEVEVAADPVVRRARELLATSASTDRD